MRSTFGYNCLIVQIYLGHNPFYPFLVGLKGARIVRKDSVTYRVPFVEIDARPISLYYSLHYFT